ncbi:MAG TPA: bifunctional phosphoribosylaminoimidazolecarboxamide formyltransferase/IMP cyclohydrolase, partial [Nevskiaceae bacterium]|nr:bifunctional phosphoribosylaminoimidazolecarboxamide formyltransferase/IMP cyclohydrolase [Nevskiaceae bacterium]
MKTPVRRALISVSDKNGIVDFARELARRGVAILSTGGTYKLLDESGVEATEISEHTGFPEIMDGRVKTLHPKVHGGLLGRRGTDDAVMREHGIAPIDLLCVNLYPFEATVARADSTYEDAVENIDIGGPAMLRAAAKNHAYVTVLTDPADYAGVLAEMDAGGVTQETRNRLALKTYAHTSRYDAAVAGYLSSHLGHGKTTTFPGVLGLQFE